jgi:malonate transporter and related proteins
LLTAVWVVIPVFALILSGYAAGRLRVLGPTAASELNKFVVFLALPALLFEVIAEADWPALWQPGFIFAFAGGALLVFALVVVARVGRGRSLADASIEALNAGYANTGYIGFPICQAVFGRESFALVTLATLITVSVVFAVAIVCIEISLNKTAQAHRTVLKVCRSLLTNPLIVAPLLGGAWAAINIPLPAALQTYLTYLGASSSPVALVSLGLFLNVEHRDGHSSGVLVTLLASLKLMVQPAITAALAILVFHLAYRTAGAAIVLAALPTGTGPFMLAEYYRRDALVTSKIILWTTAISIVTLTALISALTLN